MIKYIYPICSSAENGCLLLQQACELLFLEAAGVEEALLRRVTVAGAQAVAGRWRQQQAELLQQSLCKGVYERLFLWINKQINKNINKQQSLDTFIGEHPASQLEPASQLAR